MRKTNLFNVKDGVVELSCFECVNPKSDDIVENYFSSRQDLKHKLDYALKQIGNREIIQVVGQNAVGKTIVSSYINSKFPSSTIVEHKGFISDLATMSKDLCTLTKEYGTTIIDNIHLLNGCMPVIGSVSDIKDFYSENKYDVSVIQIYVNGEKELDIQYIK